jgi:hypothetical protein
MQSERQAAKDAMQRLYAAGPKVEQPAPPEPTPEAEAEGGRSTLLIYATAAERAELVRVRERRDAADAEGRSLTLKAIDLDGQAADARSAAERAKTARRGALVAEALGEAAPGAAPSKPATEGPGADDIAAAAAELRQRAEAKRREATEAHGELRARTIDLFDACAQRASAAYREAGDLVARLHAAVGAAQLLLDSVGQKGKLVSERWSQDLLIPTSPGLKALRGVGAVRGSVQILPLAGGDEGRCRRSAEAAYSVARSDIRDLVGSWPLDRKE